MKIKYFAKVSNMNPVEVAVAHNASQVQTLRTQGFEQCSRAFYDAALRNAKQVTPEKIK